MRSTPQDAALIGKDSVKNVLTRCAAALALAYLAIGIADPIAPGWHPLLM